MRRIKRIFEKGGVRRFFINTLFDSTFMLLGIVVGSAFVTEARLESIMATLVTASLALGISTGVSVYEAESLEQERKLDRTEKAMIQDLRGTVVHDSAKSITLVASLINFSTPLVSCAIVILPFVFAAVDVLSVESAARISIAVTLSELFIVGAYMGRIGKKNPWVKGLRMLGFGLIAFVIGLFLDSLL